MKKRFIAVIMSLVMCASLVLPVGYADVKADVKSAEILDTDVSEASDGCTLLGVYGTYYSQAMEALDKLNEIRKEACEEGDVPDPRNPERMLTADDYVPLKWSGDLESVAKIRAVEAGIAYAFMDSGHNRLNDKNTFSISYNGISGSAEDLAYNDTTDMGEGIMQFYMEKQYWVKENPTGEETGHYTSIINPKYKYVGCGDFYSKVGRFSNTLATELSEKEGLDESMLRAKKDVMQKIEVADQYIKENTIEGDSEINTDATANYTVRVKIQRNNAVRSLWALGIDSFSSSDTSIATVTDDGVVTAIKNGTVTITAKSGDKVVATKDITVKCTHNKKIKNYTPATCQTEGKKTYYCDKCDYTEEKNIPKKAHDYVYGDVESDGKRTGVCSVCGDSVHITPPSSFNVKWNNESHTERGYSETLPMDLKSGSKIYCWPESVLDDSTYNDVVIETANSNIVSVPEEMTVNSSVNRLEIKKDGVCGIKIYPKYNSRIAKNYIFRIGEKGSLNIADADVTLSQSQYTYNGGECKPDVTVTVDGDTVLEKDVDYTISYENNKTAGIAKAVINGIGIFKGSVNKEFSIAKATDEVHTSQAVTDSAKAATCIENGLTEGSHCSVCGEVITAQNVIEKTGHKYVDGKCNVCGDISYIDDSGIRYTFDEDINGNKTFKADAIPGKTLTGEVEIKEEMAIGDVKYPVASIETGAFEGQSQITKIIVPEKIEKIGTKAFAGCSSLVEINFYPKTVPVIEDKLFGDMDTSKITVNTLSNALGYYVIREKENVTVQSGLKSRHIHTMQYHEPVSATCEKTGTVAYYSCSGCGKLYCDEQGIAELKESALTVPALGHAWESDYTIDKPATKNTAGEKSIHCMRCDARTDIQTIPATGGSDDQNGSDDNSNNSSDSNSGNNNSGTSGGDSPGSNTSKKKKYPKKGKKVTVKGIRYKVTGVVAKTKKFEVSCTGSKSKKITKLSIPEYVIISGIKFKVTAIDKKAFYKYTKLKTVTIGKNVKTFGTQAFAKSSKISKITIKTTKLTKKSVGKNVFSGIKKKAKFTYPKSKKAVYKKIFKA